MSFYSNYKHVTVAEKKEKARISLEKLKKKNPDISPVIIQGRKIAKTWWGIAWNENLESYSDYSNRIGRGRSYVINGAVLDLQIKKGTVTAIVQGTRKKPYDVIITIDELSENSRKKLSKTCLGKINTLEDLLDGKFPEELSELFTMKKTGLFPSPKEILLECSCPDWADMCKHIAAVLYGIGAKLDNEPALFFTLRDINMDEFISKAVAEKSEKMLSKSKNKSKHIEAHCFNQKAIIFNTR
jgi:uncharacterized Zn finger protein